MALTKEDLQAMRAMMKEELEPVTARLDKFDGRLDKLETSYEDLEKGQLAIRADIATLNHALMPKVNAVYAGLDGILRRNEQTDRHEQKLEDHDHRIFALEMAVSNK